MDFASASADRSIKIWDPKNGNEIKKPVLDMQFVPTVGISNPFLRGRVHRQNESGTRNPSRAWHGFPIPSSSRPDATTGSRSGTFCSPREPTNPSSTSGQGGAILGVALGHCEFAVGGETKRLQAYRTEKGPIGFWNGKHPTGTDEWYRFRGHSADVMGLAFSPDDSLLVSASWDNTLKFWDTDRKTETNGLLMSIDNPKDEKDGKPKKIYCVAFSPDGRWIITGHADGQIKFWGRPQKP